jgi:hypothetical protein
MTLSPDRQHYWDGVAWHPASPDGAYYWDGTNWAPIPSEASAPSNTDVPISEAPTPDLDVGGPVMQLKGYNGQLEIYPQKLTIMRKGFSAKLYQGASAGNKDIYYRQIGSVNLKLAGFQPGFIQFSVAGEVSAARRGFGAQSKDENTVTFASRQNDVAKKIKGYVEQQVALAHSGVPAAVPAVSRVDELQKLATLRSQGVLTEEEFQAEKVRLLG